MAILELQNVSKVYQMGKISVNAVHEASFSINAGEFASVSGPSGSGKSTLLNLMGLIDLPTSGNIIIDGTDVYGDRNLAQLKSIPSSLDRHMTELRRLNLGFIFQNFNLIQVLNVRENVELPLKLGHLPQSRAMSQKEAAEWVDYLIEKKPQAVGAFRRTAPARRHRPRAKREGPAHNGGRTDRQP